MSRADHTVDQAAAGIFDMLGDDLMVDENEQDEETAGEEQDQDADSGDEDASGSDDDDENDDEESEDDEESDEDDEESDGGDEDEEDEESEDEEYEEEDESDDDDDPMVTVKVDGKTERIPQSEALAGYSRTASWTKKSQALAEERKAFEAERDTVRRNRQDYGQKLVLLEEQLGASLTQLEEPSPDDPNYERKWIQYQQAQQQVQRVQQERFALQRRIEEDQEADRQVRITENNALLVEAVPEWSDTTVALAEKRSLAKYAVEVMGFEPEDVDKLIDHRLVLLLKKAAGYDDLLKAEKGAEKELKKKKEKARVLRPGQSSQKSSSKSRKGRRTAKAKRDKLRQEGTVKAAADFIYETLDDE